MNATAAHPLPASPRSRGFGPLSAGSHFIGPVFDPLLIGGGLSLAVALLMAGMGWRESDPPIAATLTWLILFSNTAHFAASTIRLYAKPGAFQDLPFLTMGFPLVSIAAVVLCVVFAEWIGRHFISLALTWSPYHYAAQTYGLALMYGYRGGSKFEPLDRRLLWWTCMAPFLYAFVNGAGSGIGWFVEPEFYAAHPAAAALRLAVSRALGFLTFAAPAAFLLHFRLRRGERLPAISLLLVVSNGVWWLVFQYIQAFLWATVFHGVQYLAIVAIFHVKDQLRRPGNRHGWLRHTAYFYAACLGLGYFLFDVLKHAFTLAGFNEAASAGIIFAAINLHHFIVDGYIWKLRKDRNFATVVPGGAAAPEI